MPTDTDKLAIASRVTQHSSLASQYALDAQKLLDTGKSPEEVAANTQVALAHAAACQALATALTTRDRLGF